MPLPVLVDRPVEVRPPTVDLDVGLVDEPAVTPEVSSRTCRFDELRCEPLDPPLDRDVIDRDTTLSEQLLDVTVGQAVPQVPPNRHRDHLRGNRKPANAEAEDELMTPVSCPTRSSSNATLPSAVLSPEIFLRRLHRTP